jgi:nicotinamide-nucleotide amidase
MQTFSTSTASDSTQSTGSDELHALTSEVATAFSQRGWTLAVAESCTGGLLAASLTDLAGSSQWFERGYVTYSNAAKVSCLEVSPLLIEAEGAVSEAVARAMVLGAQLSSGVTAAVSITGIAGPGGGTADKPVGTVCFGWAVERIDASNHITTTTEHFLGDRQSVRQQAVIFALRGLLQSIA